MKVLVTGHVGMLGADLVPLLDINGIDWIGFDIRADKAQDLRSEQAINAIVGDFRPDWIVHLAAETDVDRCEQDPERGFSINFFGTKNLVLASRQINADFLYISTSSVFDGSKPTPYNEFDAPNPINQYAKSKFAGELYVAAHARNHIILRAGWMFGGVEEDKKFVAKIIELARDKDELMVVSDKFGSPTYTKDFAEMILQLMRLRKWGLYHGANSGFCSRYEMALQIVQLLGLDTKITPVSSAMFPLPAPRGRMEAIENWMISWEKLPKMRSWQDALQDYIETNRSAL